MSFPSSRRLAASVVVLSLLSAASAAGQNVVVTFQTGVSGGTNALTRSCVVRNSSSYANSTVVESDVLELGTGAVQAAGHALVDFPFVIGPNPGQIPPGSTIVSAKVKLRCTAAGGGSGTARTVSCKPILDPERLGTWREPALFSTALQDATVGVSWARRDGRLNADRPWLASGAAGVVTLTDPALLAQLPGFNPVITVVPNGTGSAWALNMFHEWTVTTAVQLWASGYPNQGFLFATGSAPVTYAADDHGTAAWRPKLEVTYVAPAAGAPVLNRVPRMLATTPTQPTTTQGVDLTIVAAAIDDDGTTPEVVVIKRPDNGELLGTPPFFTYRPNPGFVGADDFELMARDAMATSYPQVVSVTVNASGAVQTKTYQKGVSPTGAPGADATRSCGSRWSPYSHAAFEEAYFKVLKDQRQGFLDFPNLIGNGAGQIPPGSKILSARLELRAWDINGVGTPRRITLHRLVDPLNRGTSWWEPTTTEVDPTGGDYKGVSHTYPDARTANTPTLPPAWWVPGGDVHGVDVATIHVTAAHDDGVRLGTDVTAAVRAWSAGAPNFGWAIRNSDASNAVLFHSDDAATATDRPKLVVAYVPPSSASPPAPPHADAGGDLNAFSGQTVKLDARRTTHPNDAAYSVYWIQIAGPAVTLQPDPNDPVGTFGATSRTPRFTAPAVAVGQSLVYEFLLAAEASGLFSLDTVKVTVTAPPGGGVVAATTVNAGADVVATELAQVVLGATVTGGVGPFSYRWTKLDGPPCAVSGGTTAAAAFQAPPVGPAGVDLTFGLEVTDLGVTAFAATHYDTVTVHVVNSANAVPVANPGPARSVVAGEWTVLDGTASTDADQHPLTYSWTCTAPSSPAQNLGQYVPQGTSASAQTPWRAPNVTSTTTFVFQLAVSDNEATGTATLSLTVTAPPPSFSGSATSMAPYRQELTAAEARHLLRRMGLGWHPSDVAATVAQSKTPGVGLSGIVDAALATPQIAAVADEAMNYAPQIASPTAGVPQFNQPFDPYPSLTTAQIEAHWLIHAFRSPAALRERTAQMLHGRLAASVRNLPDGKRHWSLLHADMLRHGVVVPGTSNLVAGTGPFGDWRTMLLHFARDPVTLSFIDGFDNLRFAPNENFAREFFELHALGILDENGVPIYGETDVKESARAFTGWRPVCYALNPAKPASCEPSFSLPFHDNGLKTILGSAPTNFDDQGVVDLALDYDGGDNAARRLARLLIGHFVTETPDPALVTQLKSTILANDWDLEPVLATLLKSEAMFSASARKAIVKSPLELALGATKTLRTPLQTRDIVTGSSMWSHLKLLQHRPGNPIDVNGWPRDVEWADDYMLVRRSELLRKIVLVSRTPTPPVGGATPDYPGVAATPVALSAFLPPPTARKSDETVRLLEEIFDVDLKETTGTGGSVSEFLAAKNLLDTLTIGSGGCPSNAPFDGDCPQHADRLWSLVMLFFEHPEFARL